MRISGIWLPIITPFYKDEIDAESYEDLINFYIEQGISGIIPLGTTGESPTIDEKEVEKLIELTVSVVKGRIPIFFGHGGNCTKRVIEGLKRYENKGISGILSVGPYYNRPSTEGIYEHFKAIASSTDLDILIYNIPYRTGRNIDNNTIRRLSEFKNIVGLKDASGDIKQTTELLLDRPNDFSILTGEDYYFYHSLTLGADGGILASAHVNTKRYIDIFKLLKENNSMSALALWKEISALVPLLFQEPNPAPIKYLLKKKGLIKSEEVRLPLTTISEELKEVLAGFVN